MEEKVGGTGIAGARLKSKTGWNSSASSTDDFGFSALPSGMYTGSDFDYVGIVSNWWTASVSGTTTAWYRSISNDVADTDMNHSDFSQTIGFSVRCILD